MTLRVKTFLAVGATLALMLSVLYAALSPVVLNEFSRAEIHSARHRAQSAQAALASSLDQYSASYADWAAWDETYRFAADGNSQFIETNLEGNSLLAARANFVAIVAAGGEVRFATFFDSRTRQPGPLPKTLLSRLQPNSALLRQRPDSKPVHGFVLLPDGPMMVAALPISPDSSTDAPRGTILFGRYINSADWGSLTSATEQEVSFQTLNEQVFSGFALAKTRLVDQRATSFVQNEDEEMAAYLLIRDLENEPLGLLRLGAPTGLINQGKTALSYMALMMALCGVIFLTLAMWPIERMVLQRLARLNRMVDEMRGGEIVRRSDNGGDELSRLALNINSTFAALKSIAARQKRSERLYRQMAETALSAGDAYFVWQVGQDFLDWHGDIDTLLGYPPGGMKRNQKAWLQHIHFADQGKVVRACARALALRQPVQTEFRVIRCDGTTRHWMIRGKPLASDRNDVVGSSDGLAVPIDNSHQETAPRLLAVCIDITARKEADEALRESEERLQRIFDTAADAIIIVDRDGQITFANEAAARIFGLLRDEITSRTIYDSAWQYAALDGGEFDPSENPFHRVRATGEPVYEVQYGVANFDGARVIVSVNAAPLLDARGNFSGMVASFTDVTERRTLEDRLKYQAFHDSLTGLANRSLLRDRLEHALVRRDKRATPIAVLFIDLDNFKYINDSLGHAVGDELIVEISSRLRVSLRAGDTAARFGGDEFVVLLELLDNAHYAIQVAERLLETLREPFFLSGREVFTTPSIGIAFSSGSYDHPDELLRHADAAMYEAKRRGKARYEVFESSMSASAINRLEIENDLRRALQKGEFFLHYQPKWDLNHDIIYGFEALVRWQHPQRGLIPPGEFIPIAEETGLIVPLGFEVLKMACQQAKIWSQCAAKPLTMAVNVSARQLLLPEIVPLVAQVLDESQFSPGCLILEITESSIVERTGDMLDTLNALKALGVRLAIDDFGTGYSSLAYLRAFPFDYLKIDRQFVTNVHEEGGNGVIVSSMITLAHALNLLVIAEGAEQIEEVAHLKKLGCDMAQGYYFGKPLPHKEIEARLGFKVGDVASMP